MSGNHRFTKLGNISRKDRQVNVFAVVKFFKKPSKTKGSDMSFFFTLVDQTLFENEKSLKCLFFEKNKENFPIITNIGDIVKFTSLRITVFNYQIQGRNKSNGFSWITFDGRPNAPVVPRFSANSPQIFTDEDKKNVEGLKQWAASVHFLSSGTSQRSLAELTACEDLYFNLLCQVVAVDKHDASKKYVVLHVWDGTVPAFSRLKSDYDDSFSSATKWGAKVVGNCIEICVFPNDSDAELTVNPGDYVQITNLHLKNDTPGAQQEVVSEAQKLPSLRLHEGNSFGRGLKVLLEDDPDIKQLENRMDALIMTSSPRTESFVQRREALVTSNDHSTVSHAPSTVFQSPSTVCQAPSTVSQSPSTVSQAPSTVSQAPSTVSQAPSTVFQSPSTVSQAPSIVSQSSSTVFQCPSTVSQSPSAVFQSPSAVFQSPSTVVQATSTVSQAPSTVFQATSAVFQSPSIVSQSPSTVFQSPSAVSQAPSTVFQATSAVFQAPSAVFQAPSAVFQATSAVFQAPSAVVQAISTVSQAPSAVLQAPSAVFQAPSAVFRAPSAVFQAPSAVCQPPSAVFQPHSTVFQPPSTVFQPPSNPCASDSTLSTHHRFTMLGNISRMDRRVNVFAVVKFFKKPTKTKGIDMSFFFTLVHPTLFENEQCLKCLFFAKNEVKFPVITNIGDIVKFTSLDITVFNDQIQGRNKNHGFSWITFDGRPNAPVVPRFSSNSQPIVTDEDKKNVEELKKWAASVDFLSVTTSRRSLAELTACEDFYFDLLCQVVSVGKHDATTKYVALHVWDGTVPSVSRLKSRYDYSFSSATKWGAKVIDNCIQICVFLKDSELTVNPGDYVQITNLHLTFKEDMTHAELVTDQEEAVSESTREAQKVPFIILHEGSSFGRGIRLLQEDDPDIRQLVNIMEALHSPPSNKQAGVIQRPSGNGASVLPAVPEHLHFTRLRKISTTDFCVNIFGVVKSFRRPAQSKGCDRSFCFSIVDSSMYKDEACLKCLFFEKDDANFPVINNIGDVVKFTSLGITMFQGRFQGRNDKRGFSWMTFDGRSNAPVVPRFSPNSPATLTERDERVVKCLKKWATSIYFLSRAISRRSLSELIDDDTHFDLLCQVVAVEERDATSRSVVLHVWDGTVPALSTVKSEDDHSFSSATGWGAKVVGNCVKIYVSRNDRDPAVPCYPEEYVQLTNLCLTSKERAMAGEAMGDEVVENEGTRNEVIAEESSGREVIEKDVTKEETVTVQVAAKDAKSAEEYKMEEAASLIQKVLFLRHDRPNSQGPRLRLLRLHSPDVMMLIDRIEALPSPPSVPRVKIPTSNTQFPTSNTRVKIPTSNTRVKIPASNTQSAIAQQPSNSSASVSGKGEAEKLLINNRDVCGELSEIPLRDTQMKASHFPPVSEMSQGPPNRGASACGKGETRKEQAMEEETIGAEVLAKCGVEQQRPLNLGSASVGSKNVLTKKRKLCKEPTEALFGNRKFEDNAVSNVAIPGQELAAGSSGFIVTRSASKRRIRRCSIAKVVERPSVPITFICRARVWNYCPEDASEYVKYVCLSCRNVCNPRELSHAGGKRTCPRSSCGKPLSLTLCVSLILTDDISCLDVILFGNEAQQFFSDVDPAVLLTDQGVQRSVTERMRSLREGKILLDFVVKSYYGPEDENGDELIMYKIKKIRSR